MAGLMDRLARAVEKGLDQALGKLTGTDEDALRAHAENARRNAGRRKGSKALRRKPSPPPADRPDIPQDWLCEFGPSIGIYKGEEIPEWVQDNAGRRYYLDGTCEYDSATDRPLFGKELGEKVRVIAPGLVYRLRA